MTTLSEIYKVKRPVVWKSPLKVKECSFPDHIFGIELEIENLPHRFPEFPGVEMDSKTGHPKGFKVTEDGSLRGRFAYEFVSYPMDQAHLIEETAKLLTGLGVNDGNYSDRCSIHLHSNVAHFIPEQLSCLFLLYSVVEEVLFKHVGRYRDTNIYCIPWYQSKACSRWVRSLCADGDLPPPRDWQKYAALNYAPMYTQGSVEFRHFYGTHNMEEITKWINILGCVMKYATNFPRAHLEQEILSLNTTSQYERFFYSVFGKWLEYSSEYNEPLENGIIQAKYSMLSDKKVVKKVGEPFFTTIDEALGLEVGGEQTVNPIPGHGHFRPAPRLDDLNVYDARDTREEGLNQRAEVLAGAGEVAPPRAWPQGRRIIPPPVTDTGLARHLLRTSS